MFCAHTKKIFDQQNLRALSGLTNGGKFYKVNLDGDEAESILTNSAKLAKIIEVSKCSSTEDVIRDMEKHVRGEEWEEAKRGFEQHMLEEDRVGADWERG